MATIRFCRYGNQAPVFPGLERTGITVWRITISVNADGDLEVSTHSILHLPFNLPGIDDEF
jgi:hypothetical protein